MPQINSPEGEAVESSGVAGSVEVNVRAPVGPMNLFQQQQAEGVSLTAEEIADAANAAQLEAVEERMGEYFGNAQPPSCCTVS